MEDRVKDVESDKDLLAQKWKVGSIVIHDKSKQCHHASRGWRSGIAKLCARRWQSPAVKGCALHQNWQSRQRCKFHEPPDLVHPNALACMYGVSANTPRRVPTCLAATAPLCQHIHARIGGVAMFVRSARCRISTCSTTSRTRGPKSNFLWTAS